VVRFLKAEVSIAQSIDDFPMLVCIGNLVQGILWKLGKPLRCICLVEPLTEDTPMAFRTGKQWGFFLAPRWSLEMH
tara:strand:+ start:2742 stop:2969 length:228 start_codon:yes stop_codon:yes gene_type:complete